MTNVAEQKPEARGRTPDSAERGSRVTRPQRILIVSDAWLPQVNGVVGTYRNIARELQAAGCDLRIIGPADFPNRAMPGYPEIRLALPLSGRLERMIEAFDPQAIHIAVEGPLGWAARRWCLRNRRSFSTAFHTNFPEYVSLRAPGPLRPVAKAAATACLRRFHGPARFVYVATPGLARQLSGMGVHNRFVLLSRGVDTALFRPAVACPGVASPPVFLYVGRIAPEKNIEAFLSLAVTARKVVVGDGPSLAVLMEKYPDADFRGVLLGEQLASAYREADLFVFPSKTDTFGNVLLEALASGLPCAAFDVTGPRDIIGADPTLGAVDEDLAVAVARALASCGTRQSRHLHAQRTYSWTKVAQVFHSHCAELCP